MKEIKPQVFYASLAIYSKRARQEEISLTLDINPTTHREKSGVFSWIFSTKDDQSCTDLEQHLKLLRHRFDGVTEKLVQLSRDDCEMRLWIYLEAEEINSAILLEEEFVAWLARFRADVYVDVWIKRSEGNAGKQGSG